MTASVMGVVVGLLALAARGRTRGTAWSATLALTLCTGAAFSVFELARSAPSWRASLAFALLGAAGWLITEPELARGARSPRALGVAVALAAGALQPSWLPGAVAIVGGPYFATWPERRKQAALVGLAGVATFATVAAGGQVVLNRSAAVLRESWVRRIPDMRHENATLAAALAVLLILALVARVGTTKGNERSEQVPGVFWLVFLAAQTLVLGARPELRADGAILPLLLGLALIPSARAESLRGLASPALSGLAGLALGLANGLVPSALGDEPELARAARMRTAFSDGDVLIFPHRPSFELAYYAELPSFTFADLRRRTQRRKPLEALEVEVQRASSSGHGVWLAVDGAGHPLPGMLDARDMGRIVWGVSVGSGDSAMRQVRAVASAAPCSSPAAPAERGRSRASADAFVESNLGRAHAPERAIDGDPKTEWLTPSGEAPWLDVSLETPRSLRGLRLLGAQNLPYRDFETRAARIQVYLAGNLVASSEVTLAGGRWRALPLAADRVDCVRVLVLAHRGRGGGLAEIELY